MLTETTDLLFGKKRERLLFDVNSYQRPAVMYLFFVFLLLPVKMRNLNINDNIVVESCFVRLQLRDTPAHHSFREESKLSVASKL